MNEYIPIIVSVVALIGSVFVGLPALIASVTLYRQGNAVREEKRQERERDEKNAAIAAQKADDLAKEVRENTAITAQVKEKTEKIEVATNSHLSEVTAKLDVANSKVDALQELVTRLLERDARVDGQKAIVGTAIEPPVLAETLPPAPAQSDKLEVIAETGFNTNERVQSIQKKVEAVEDVVEAQQEDKK